jgi:hypothetical protein
MKRYTWWSASLFQSLLLFGYSLNTVDVGKIDQKLARAIKHYMVTNTSSGVRALPLAAKHLLRG